MAARERTATGAETEAGDRRRTILRAAIDVFARKGFHGCRIADVAQEAGVAYGLVYHYFKNKDELLQSVFEVTFKGFVQRMRQVAEGDGPLGEKVLAICRAAFDAYRIDPRAVRVLILEIARSPVGARVQRDSAFVEVIRLSAAMFEAARLAGELRRDADPMLSAVMLFGAIETGLTSIIVGLIDGSADGELDRAARRLSEAFLRGVLSDTQAGHTVPPPPRRRGKTRAA